MRESEAKSQREIKFREYDFNKDKMFYYYLSSGNKIIVEQQFLSCDEDRKQSKLMQFTGLKDKNGVDIYEGDIVLYSEIVFSSNPLRLHEKEYAEFKWNDKHKRIDLYIHSKNQDNYFEELGDDISLMEVIGNIYENQGILDDEELQRRI